MNVRKPLTFICFNIGGHYQQKAKVQENKNNKATIQELRRMKMRKLVTKINNKTK